MQDTILLYICQSVTLGIGIFLCLIVLLIYTLAKPLRIFAFKIVFWLNLSNLIKSIALLMSIILLPYPTLCKIDAYFYYTFSLSSFLWTFVIAHKMHQSMLLSDSNLESHYKLTVILIFLFSFTTCSVPLVLNLYEVNDPDCLLQFSPEGDAFRLVLYYIPGMSITIYCLVIYTKLLRAIRNSKDSQEKDTLRLRYFSLILAVCVTPVFVVRIFQYFNIFYFYVYAFASALACSQAALDALAYAFTPPVIRYIGLIMNSKTRSLINGSDLLAELTEV